MFVQNIWFMIISDNTGKRLKKTNNTYSLSSSELSKNTSIFPSTSILLFKTVLSTLVLDDSITGAFVWFGM